ncbi:hypothetical protein TRIP_C21394 [Candidatus Zixiibacteriota bacterium]|nr:hypothetical protein TRIP_C21394 [candidate division Zixibacteria bacterium]
MKYGLVVRNVTDLRAKPKFHSERRSQILFNEFVRMGNIVNGYCHICQSDGYQGWVDIRALKALPEKNHKFKPDCLINTPVCHLKSGSLGSTANLPFIFYGTSMKLSNIRGTTAIVADWRGNEYRVSRGQISPVGKSGQLAGKGRQIVTEAGRFIGTPYLWGGITSFGIDCSGLVQMVYRSIGKHLPRDSSQQRKTGRKVNLEAVKSGDLFFFKGHVAIAIDKYRMIHSSLGSGGVYYNSMNPHDPDYRSDLADIFIEARRVLK